MKKYINKWFMFDFNGSLRCGRCVGVEFHEKLGPIFSFVSNYGNGFRLTKGEISDHEISGRVHG